MKFRLLILVTYLLCHIEALVVKNIFFNKVNEFSMSNIRWLITFVISINHYDDFQSKLSMDIDKASNISESVLSIYTPEKMKPIIDPKSHYIYSAMHTNISDTYKRRFHTSFDAFYEVFKGLRRKVQLTNACIAIL